MMDVRIAAIVEGHGECEAVPILVRRIAETIDPAFVPDVLSPLRVNAAKLLKSGEIERYIELAARKISGLGGIVILVDCDDGCPATDAPALLERATSVRKDLPIVVILAKREFESWFLAAAESLRGRRGLPPDLEPPSDPESIRGAKEWLSHKMGPSRGYSETDDQPALAAVFDLDAARRADSFDKCFRDIRRVLERLREQG